MSFANDYPNDAAVGLAERVRSRQSLPMIDAAADASPRFTAKASSGRIARGQRRSFS